LAPPARGPADSDVYDGLCPRAKADELPDGTYRITVYFRAMGGDEIEFEGGEVELAVPR
jgi:hypothetical protein